MILRFFRSSEPFTLFFLPFIAGVLYLFRIIGEVPPVHKAQGPLHELLLPYISSYPAIDMSVGIVLVVVQAVLFNRYFNEHEFVARNTNLPSLVYVVFAAGFFPAQGGHALLFGNLFILLAIARIWQVYRQASILSQVFEAGLFVGIAALFYPPYLYLLPFFWVAISILRPFKWREWALLLFGLLVPGIYATVWFWWHGALPSWEMILPTGNFEWVVMFSENELLDWISIGFFALLLLLSVGGLMASFAGSIKRIRNLKRVAMLFAVGLFGLYAFSLFGFPTPERLAFLVIPCSFLLTLLFWKVRSWKGEFLIWGILVLMMLGSWVNVWG